MSTSTASKRPPAASRPSRGRGRIAAWRDAHLYSLISSFGRIAARPWGTLLSVGVMAIALALPFCLGLLLDEVGRFSGELRDSRELALFLEVEQDAASAEALAETLRADPRIQQVELRTPEQGLAELRSTPDLAGALAALEHNPLPWVVLAMPVAGTDETALADELAGHDGIDLVQHDDRWRQRLEAWIGFGRRFGAVVAVLLALGALLVVGNTVRLDVQGRADEIATVRLLGATDGFVRRPFLYLGACYGALAGLLALLLAALVRLALQAPVATLIASYQGDFVLASLPLPDAAGLWLGAVALGWLGAFLAVGHHLRHAEGTE